MKSRPKDTLNALLDDADQADSAREKIRHRLLTPLPVESLDEVRDLVSPRLEYIGPGPWIALLRDLSSRRRKGGAAT